MYSNSTDMRGRYKARNISGVWDAESELGDASGAGNKRGQTSLNKIIQAKNNKHITSIEIYTFGTGFHAGTVIDVWGVRADA